MLKIKNELYNYHERNRRQIRQIILSLPRPKIKQMINDTPNPIKA
jgi:hypothetical protein